MYIPYQKYPFRLPSKKMMKYNVYSHPAVGGLVIFLNDEDQMLSNNMWCSRRTSSMNPDFFLDKINFILVQ